ncbi:ThiF family adenylyltransferase [Oribacterium sp. FC2011]|uniref:ThiF family adenylyltransferase n=1 Tax=Oribacterium sp. FC2011 TaxID=1408311 RepID=UPI0004E10D68|nr:ThiF family adenylyltransferase [Oribacterium sp. FC2011]
MVKNPILDGFNYLLDGLEEFVDLIIGDDYDNNEPNDLGINMTFNNGIPDKSVLFSTKVLDEFRKDVGRFRAETGGILASTGSEKFIDKCCFDTHSNNTSNEFYYDVEAMSVVFRNWKAAGYITNGIYHSHPKGCTEPSYHDISSSLLHIDFFGLDYFYLPIFQPDPRGLYKMYFYIVRKIENNLEVTLSYVLEAMKEGYRYVPFRSWKQTYSIDQLRRYRELIDKADAKHSEKNNAEKTAETLSVNSDSLEENIAVTTCEGNADPEVVENTDIKGDMKDMIPTNEYFTKVSALYPEKVLDKVIVCIGTGGARSFLENCARSGFRNYILMDADIVSPSNIATQGVFISEMGKKKVDVIRDRIMDINPEARVICVDRFLDDYMSDEEFVRYMSLFPGKKPTDYLILGCTDNFEAQKRSSLLALKYGNPYLAAMMYEGGAAAEIIFVYPGVTESCPRCLLRDRFEKYENGFVNDVDSSACPIFATERMNSLKGYIALMLMMYGEDPKNPLSRELLDVKDRNFVEIRLTPYLKDSKLGIGLFDRVFSDVSRYTFFDETLWIPQHPDRPEYGEEPCKLCGGTGDLTMLQDKWKTEDTRFIRF